MYKIENIKNIEVLLNTSWENVEELPFVNLREIPGLMNNPESFKLNIVKDHGSVVAVRVYNESDVDRFYCNNEYIEMKDLYMNLLNSTIIRQSSLAEVSGLEFVNSEELGDDFQFMVIIIDGAIVAARAYTTKSPLTNRFYMKESIEADLCKSTNLRNYFYFATRFGGIDSEIKTILSNIHFPQEYKSSEQKNGEQRSEENWDEHNSKDKNKWYVFLLASKILYDQEEKESSKGVYTKKSQIHKDAI